MDKDIHLYFGFTNTFGTISSLFNVTSHHSNIIFSFMNDDIIT